MQPKRKQTKAGTFGDADLLREGTPSSSRPPPQVPPEPRHRRWVDDLVEQRSSPDQQRETDDLQPLEGFPAQAQRDEPDEERAAGVDRAARGGADLAGDGEAEEVETAG